LIVEDDAFLSFIEETIVSRLGYEVVGTATSGEEALKQAEKLNPDILLVDVQLDGEMDGIQTVMKLRERQFNNPVIFISGTSENSIIENAKKISYTDYLVKPIDLSMLEGPLKKAEKSRAKPYNAA